MASLEDPRHELFAQHVSAGVNPPDAYEQAGFNPTTRASARSAASRLMKNVDVRQRIAEMQAETAEKCEITRDSIARQFDEVVNRALTTYDAIDAKERDGTQHLERAIKAIVAKASYAGIVPAVPAIEGGPVDDDLGLEAQGVMPSGVRGTPGLHSIAGGKA